MTSLEKEAHNKGYAIVAGVDEAGRGPLAGPVVAAAVSLINPRFKAVIRDSKKMSRRQRECAFIEIWEKAHVGVGMVNEKGIDSLNILRATFVAMENAVTELVAEIVSSGGQKNAAGKIFLLIDGNRFTTSLPYPYRTVIAGEDKSLSIACASIIAKVIRDRMLDAYDKVFPQYGFSRHKGYPTAFHRQALKKFGPSLIHRRTFTLC